jgi:hypothetical protein
LHLDAQHCLSREELIATGYLIADAPQGTPQEAPRETLQPSPQLLGTCDPPAAVARMQELRQQGFSLTRIADILTQEGIPTRYGLPWQHSSVRHLLKTYG